MLPCSHPSHRLCLPLGQWLGQAVLTSIHCCLPDDAPAPLLHSSAGIAPPAPAASGPDCAKITVFASGIPIPAAKGIVLCLGKTAVGESISYRTMKWLRDWTISHLRKGCRSWDCSGWSSRGSGRTYQYVQIPDGREQRRGGQTSQWWQ